MTGFKVNNHFLITDDYLFKIYKAVKVKISFVNSDGYTENASIEIPMNELKKRIIKGIDKEKTSFVAINMDFEEFAKIPSLKLSTNKTIEIGQSIAVLGYQLDQENLSIKTGIVSSAFKHDNGLKYLQVDSNIKQGNSGSPLINAETGEVIGIIGHKLATITQSHKRMKQIINNNLAILKKSQGKFNVEEIDPIQVLIANQNQIKHITNEIYKTATMSIGYALDISYVHDLFEEFIDAEVSQTSLKFQIDV
ncbi:MAG: serine protease [Bacteroidales bacterium]|nr:serine protease [Bacteroidales bacterium]